MSPSRYEHYLDLSGRISASVDGHEFATVGAISVLPECASALRNCAAGLPKWRDSDRTMAEEAARVIKGGSLVALTLRVMKASQKWADFWKVGDEYHSAVAQAEGAARSGFLKPANVILYWLYGECSARLMGETVRRLGRPAVLDGRGLSVIQMAVVCDSDIQGDVNRETFLYLWERLERRHPLLNRFGLHVTFSPPVRITTEQEEPILLLADHLAGAIQCMSGRGVVPIPAGMSQADLKVIRSIYATLPNHVPVDIVFDLEYEKIFANTELGAALWQQTPSVRQRP